MISPKFVNFFKSSFTASFSISLVLANEPALEFGAATLVEIIILFLKKHVVSVIFQRILTFFKSSFTTSFNFSLVLANEPTLEFGAAIYAEIL